MVCIILTILCLCFSVSDSFAQSPPGALHLPVDCNRFDFTAVVSNSNGNASAPLPNKLRTPFPIFTTFVNCISTTIRTFAYGGDGPTPAPDYLLHSISVHMTPIVAALSILAIMTHAIRILGGEKNVTASTVKMLIKIAAVNYFYFDMGGFSLGGPTDSFPFAALPFKIMDELARTVANTSSYNVFSANGFGLNTHPTPPANSPWTPWGSLDFLVGIIFGNDPFGLTATDYVDMTVCPTGTNCNYFGSQTDSVRGFSPANGMLALFAMAAFSGAPGAMLTLAGLMACFEILMFALDVIYVYLLCELLLALCVIISPFMIPLALWQYTNRYFQKWINTMVGSALVPAFLFGFLWMTLNLLCQPVNDLIVYMNPGAYYDENNNPWYEPYARKNQEVASWSQGMSGSYASSLSGLVDGATATASKAHTPAVGQYMDSRGSAKSLANASALGAFDQMTWGVNLVGANNCSTYITNPCCNDVSCDPNGQNCVSAPSCSSQDKNITHAVFAALTLWVFASVLVGLCKQIPSIAQQIGGSMAGIGFKEKGAFPQQQLQSKIGSMTGGRQGGGGTGGSFGSMLSSRAGKSSNSQSGAASGGSASSTARSGVSSLIGNR